jgi:hypothetical protein
MARRDERFFGRSDAQLKAVVESGEPEFTAWGHEVEDVYWKHAPAARLVAAELEEQGRLHGYLRAMQAVLSDRVVRVIQQNVASAVNRVADVSDEQLSTSRVVIWMRQGAREVFLDMLVDRWLHSFRCKTLVEQPDGSMHLPAMQTPVMDGRESAGIESWTAHAHHHQVQAGPGNSWQFSTSHACATLRCG